jgi:polysaccharide export outer membrane protein
MKHTAMKHPLVSSLFVGVLLASVMIAGREPAHAQAPSVDVSDQNGSRSAGPEAYRIGPEDMLHISVWKNEAMSKIVPVRPDGKISLPLVNDVQAAGLTALELRQELTQKLAEYIPNPEVSVIVSDVRSFKVSVMGEVARPGRFELKSWTTSRWRGGSRRSRRARGSSSSIPKARR